VIVLDLPRPVAPISSAAPVPVPVPWVYRFTGENGVLRLSRCCARHQHRACPAPAVCDCRCHPERADEDER